MGKMVLTTRIEEATYQRIKTGRVEIGPADRLPLMRKTGRVLYGLRNAERPRESRPQGLPEGRARKAGIWGAADESGYLGEASYVPGPVQKGNLKKWDQQRVPVV